MKKEIKKAIIIPAVKVRKYDAKRVVLKSSRDERVILLGVTI